MTQQIIGICVNFAVTGLLGYAVATIKNYKNKLGVKENNEKLQNMALLTLLQTQLTNVYFLYADRQEITDYMYKNWLNLLKVYESLGGDDYVHTIADKMKSWKITRTDILDK